jgi:type IV secretion system protein VirB8
MGIFSFAKSDKPEQQQSPVVNETPSEDTAKQWGEDRYESMVVQRNLMFLLSLVCVAVIFVAVFFIGKLTLHKSVQPMVIEIEESTGITNIVNPLEDKKWMEARAVNEYFLIKYLRSRETYNVATYVDMYNNSVRLMSSSSVYEQFKQIINDPNSSPVVKYGGNNYTVLKVRSVQFLPSTQNGKNVQIRFAVVEKQGQKQIYNKIASIVFNYLEMNLSFEDRMINPLGFQVSSYSVTEEKDV